jgi:hypothetical protein
MMACTAIHLLAEAETDARKIVRGNPETIM